MFFTDLWYPKTTKTLFEIIDGREYNTYQGNTDMKVINIQKPEGGNSSEFFILEIRMGVKN